MDRMNDRFGTQLKVDQIILSHTPLRGSFKDTEVVLTTAQDEFGSHEISEAYGIKRWVNLIEICCIYPLVTAFSLREMPEFADCFFDMKTGEELDGDSWLRYNERIK